MRDASAQGDSREGDVRSTSRPNEEQVHSSEKYNEMSEMVKAGELRSQPTAYNITFSSKF